MTREEAKQVVMGTKSFKAPIPDGFQPFFFKKYWHIVGDDVWKLVSDAFTSGTLDYRLMETLIVPIPKVEHPSRFTKLRPISLCNVIYKVITKVMVNCLHPHLDELIGPFQSRSVPGRGHKR